MRCITGPANMVVTHMGGYRRLTCRLCHRPMGNSDAYVITYDDAFSGPICPDDVADKEALSDHLQRCEVPECSTCTAIKQFLGAELVKELAGMGGDD